MNTTEFISALKMHGSFPTSNDLFSTDDFLSLLNHQVSVDILPMMLRLNEEFLLHSQDFTISSGETYRIPRRAIGAKLRDLQVIDSSGNPTPLDRLFEEDRPRNPSGYYLVRNSVELSSDFTSGTLRMKFFTRPSKLVSVNDCAQIESIDSGTSTVVVSSAPATFATDVEVDFVQNNNPYDLLALNSAISSLSGTSITFSSLPDDLEVGDWICLAGESPVLVFPEEIHPILVQSALCKALSSKKDKAYKDEMETLERVKHDAVNMLDPRVENGSIKMRSGSLLSYFSNRRFR